MSATLVDAELLRDLITEWTFKAINDADPFQRLCSASVCRRKQDSRVGSRSCLQAVPHAHACTGQSIRQEVTSTSVAVVMCPSQAYPTGRSRAIPNHRKHLVGLLVCKAKPQVQLQDYRHTDSWQTSPVFAPDTCLCRTPSPPRGLGQHTDTYLAHPTHTTPCPHTGHYRVDHPTGAACHWGPAGSGSRRREGMWTSLDPLVSNLTESSSIGLVQGIPPGTQHASTIRPPVLYSPYL
jgi:hypothetical protein